MSAKLLRKLTAAALCLLMLLSLLPPAAFAVDEEPEYVAATGVKFDVIHYTAETLPNEYDVTELSLAIGQNVFITADVQPINATVRSVYGTDPAENAYNQTYPVRTGDNIGSYQNIGYFNPVSADYNRMVSRFSVSAQSPGEMYLTVYTTDGDIAATLHITSYYADVEDITIPESTLTLTEGDSLTYTPQFTPANASNKKYTWESSDSLVVSVGSAGQIHAIQPGTATLTVTAEDGGIAKTCDVTVLPNTAPAYLEIGTPQELADFANAVNGGNTFAGKVVRLTADIDAASVCPQPKGWDPIGTINGTISTSDDKPFSGTFDGAGHTISGLFMKRTSTINPAEDGAGLFGCIFDATIKNLNVEGDLTGISAIGGIAGYASGNVFIYNCTNKAAVTETGKNGFVAGILGTYYGTLQTGQNATLSGKSLVVQDCVNYGTILATMSTGAGVVGGGSGAISIKGCRNFGDVTCTTGYSVGGILGPNTNWPSNGTHVNGAPQPYDESRILIENCSNSGNLAAYSAVGGIMCVVNGVYNAPTLKIVGCANTGRVYGEDAVGGLLGGVGRGNHRPDVVRAVNICGNDRLLHRQSGSACGACGAGQRACEREYNAVSVGRLNRFGGGVERKPGLR
ncbi:MAG: Ig-like domain-containing protein [Oscillospiraceae bacterium]|jgi:hypothetical protein|nr:Ig-like domain-containing protein [Oscillospiraceae bacterium]